MNRKIYVLLSLILVLILATGCSSEKKALEQGEKALANEQLEEAKAHFETAVEKGNTEKAKEYLQVIDVAEQFVELTKNEEFDQAIELLDELKEHSLYSKVRFHTRDSEELVQEVITQRQMISTEIELLNDLFKADGKGFVPDEAYFDKLDELLNEKYISDEQIATVTEIREAAEKKRDEANKPEHNGGEGKPEPDKPGNNQGNKDDNKGESDNNTPPVDDSDDGGNDEDQPSNEAGTLSVEDAELLVYNYLASQYSTDFLEEPNININYDHEDGGKYYFQFFEVMDGRTQTIGWYSVDQHTKAVAEAFN